LPRQTTGALVDAAEHGDAGLPVAARPDALSENRSGVARARGGAVHAAEGHLIHDAPEPAVVLDLDQRATPSDDGEDARHVETDHAVADLDPRLFRHSGRGACRAMRGIARRCLGAERPAQCAGCSSRAHTAWRDRKSTRLNSSHEWISYAVFCLKKKTTHRTRDTRNPPSRFSGLTRPQPITS